MAYNRLASNRIIVSLTFRQVIEMPIPRPEDWRAESGALNTGALTARPACAGMTG